MKSCGRWWCSDGYANRDRPGLAGADPAAGRVRTARLEASLLRDGCLDALKVWKNGEELTLLDGHNRIGLCQKLNLPYRVEVVESVTNRYEAIQWMIDLQLARRNLTPERQSYLRGRRYNEEKCEYGAESGGRGNQYSVVNGHDDNLPTHERLAQIYGTSARTITRDAMYASAVDSLPSPERLEVLAGKSCKTKAEIVRDYLTKTGRCRNRSAAPPEKDYQLILRKSLSAIDDLLATYSRDIRLEILQTTLRHLRRSGHLAPEDIHRVWQAVQGEPAHD